MAPRSPGGWGHTLGHSLLLGGKRREEGREKRRDEGRGMGREERRGLESQVLSLLELRIAQLPAMPSVIKFISKLVNKVHKCLINLVLTCAFG